MKTTLLAASLLALITHSAQADMVTGAIKFYTPGNQTANTFGIRAYHDSVPQDPYIDFVQSYGPTKSFFSLLRFERLIKPVGVTVPFDGRLYLVNKGQVVTAASVDAEKYKRLNSADGGMGLNKSATVGRDFWVLVAIKKNAPQPQQPTYRSFSWAHLKFNTAGQLEMLDHITAFEEHGLVIGEKTPCKAPACLAAAATP